MGVKGDVFRHISDEESQNDFFVSLLAWSLEDGPRVLNAIHDEISFGEKAEVIASQRNGLRHHAPENENKRTLDWVVRDADKLVGYESKTGGNTPSGNQLREERQKLEVNSNGRDVYLFAVTDHAQQPAIVSKASVEWVSWYQVAERVLALDAEDKAIQMLQEMFQEKDYDGFGGFTEFKRENRWLTKHGTEFVDLAFDVNRHLDDFEIYTEGDNHLWHRTRKRLDTLRKHGYLTINQAYHYIHYHPKGNPEYVENRYQPSLFLPALENDLRVYMDINARNNETNQEFVQENASTLGRMVDERGMHLRTSWNSFNKPDREFLLYESADEIETVLLEEAGRENWKRLLFGWEVSVEQSPRSIIRESTNRIEELKELFYERSEFFSEAELPEW